jgi:ABC-type glutathione transport system ATPase component
MSLLQVQHALLRAERLSATQQYNVGIDLTLTAGDRIGILGAPGSGKTALLRTLARLCRPVSGQLRWQDVNVTRKPRWLLGRQRSFVAMLLTNPYTSLAPWAPVRQFFTKSRPTRSVLAELLQGSGMPAAASDANVRSLSGVARVRLATACVLQYDPRILLVDDVFRMILPEVWERLFVELDAQAGTTRALVVASRFWQALQGTHDLVVLYQGHAVEWGPRASVFAHPGHPYTRWLLEQSFSHRQGDLEAESVAEKVIGQVWNEKSILNPCEVASGHWVRWGSE